MDIITSNVKIHVQLECSVDITILAVVCSAGSLKKIKKNFLKIIKLISSSSANGTYNVSTTAPTTGFSVDIQKAMLARLMTTPAYDPNAHINATWGCFCPVESSQSQLLNVTRYWWFFNVTVLARAPQVFDPATGTCVSVYQCPGGRFDYYTPPQNTNQTVILPALPPLRPVLPLAPTPLSGALRGLLGGLIGQPYGLQPYGGQQYGGMYPSYRYQNQYPSYGSYGYPVQQQPIRSLFGGWF